MSVVTEGFDYRMTTRVRYCEDNGEILEYGIELMGGPDETNLVCRGISCSRDMVQKLLDRLQFYRITPAHFNDIIEDYIEECYGVDLNDSASKV